MKTANLIFGIITIPISLFVVCLGVPYVIMMCLMLAAGIVSTASYNYKSGAFPCFMLYFLAGAYGFWLHIKSSSPTEFHLTIEKFYLVFCLAVALFHAVGMLVQARVSKEQPIEDVSKPSAGITVGDIPINISVEFDYAAQLREKINEIHRKAEESIVSANGLRPNEIYFLSCATKYTTSQTDFPQYWYYEMAIDEPRELLDRLESLGFIEPASAAESLKSLKVPELKKILTELNLTVSGKKDDLIERICANASEGYLDSKMGSKNYALTELGNDEVSENEYAVYFGKSRKYGFDIWEMNQALRLYPMLSYRDIVWQKLNTDMAKLLLEDSNEPISRSYIYHEMGSFLLEEDNTAYEALQFFAKHEYYNIAVDSVRSYRIALQDYISGKDAVFPKFKDCCFFDSYSFRHILYNLRIPPEEMYMEMVEIFSKLDTPEVSNNVIIPKDALTCEDAAGIIIFTIQDDSQSLEQIYNKVSQALLQCKLPVWQSIR